MTDLLLTAVEQCREAARRQGVGYAQVAERAGLHQRTVRRLMEGQRLNERTLRQVAGALGVRLDDPAEREAARLRMVIREEVRGLEAGGPTAAQIGTERHEGPVAGWKEAATYLRVSERHIREQRREVDDRTPPWWRSRQALYEWWEALLHQALVREDG